MVRLAYRMGEALDRLVGVFSPKREYARQSLRAMAARLEHRYAAGVIDAHTGPLGVGALGDRDPNRLIGERWSIIAGRLRQLERDFPIFARIVNLRTNILIGGGIRLQYNARTPDGKSDNALNNEVENMWAEWGLDCDAAGSLTWHDFERLLGRACTIPGEALFLMALDPAGAGVPLRLQMIEPDWLTGWGAQPRGDIDVIQGVEIDLRSGRVLGYWLEDPLKPMQPKRVDAADVVHFFLVQRPGQLRGVSPLVSAVSVARDLGEYVGAEIEGAMLAARYLATAETSDPAGFAAGRTNQTKTDASGKKTNVHELGHNIIEILRPGEKLNLTSHSRPGTQFEPTVNFLTRLMAVAADLSYELVSGDYTGVSFSNMQGIRGDLSMQNRPTQQLIARRVHQRIFNRVLDAAHLSGRLRLPDYWGRRAEYQRAATWGLPGIEGADVLREAKAMLDKMRAGLISPQDILARAGRDPREVLEAIKTFMDMAQEIGVPLDWARTPIKQNPAAMGAGDGGDTTTDQAAATGATDDAQA